MRRTKFHWATIAVAGLVALVSGATFARTQDPARRTESEPAPVADHHQHLGSPELAALMAATPPASPLKARTAADLVAQLDAAGIRKAVVLSTAYIFEQPSRKASGAAEKLRRENDWTSAQVAAHPGRLIGFCGLNPLKDYALDELARCAEDPNLRHGLKLHFGNSVVDYHDPKHIEQLRRVFRAANDHHMAIVVHARASVTVRMPYGRDEALIFLNEILPAAPDVVVQVAHLAGAGPWEEGTEQALAVLAEAVAKHDPRTRLLYFDVTSVSARATPETAQRFAALIRQIGLERIVFGSDAAAPNMSLREVWTALRKLLPLTDAEFRTLAANVAPYLR